MASASPMRAGTISRSRNRLVDRVDASVAAISPRASIAPRAIPSAFERSFRLPDDVDRDKIAADCAKGVLTVTLLKTAEAQQEKKKIEVKSAS